MTNKVIIVDDHPLAVMAIKILLENAGFIVAGTCDNGTAVQAMVQQQQPDIVIIDVDLPGINGIDVVKRLRNYRFTGIIIVISGKNSAFYGQRSAEVKANGFVSKKNDLPSLVNAIQAAQNGYGYFPISLEDGDVSARMSDSDKLNSLSAQELIVFRLVAQGLTNMEIAEQMRISNKTVGTYKIRMREKLGCQSQKEVYDFSIRNNME